MLYKNEYPDINEFLEYCKRKEQWPAQEKEREEERKRRRKFEKETIIKQIDNYALCFKKVYEESLDEQGRFCYIEKIADVKEGLIIYTWDKYLRDLDIEMNAVVEFDRESESYYKMTEVCECLRNEQVDWNIVRELYLLARDILDKGRCQKEKTYLYPCGILNTLDEKAAFTKELDRVKNNARNCTHSEEDKYSIDEYELDEGKVEYWYDKVTNIPYKLKYIAGA